MEKLKLIYFDGCPLFSPAVALLEEAGVEFEVVDQGKLGSDDPFFGYSSRTLLLGELVIFGSRSGGSGCTLKLPSLEALRERIRQSPF